MIVHVRETSPAEAKAAIGRADAAFKAWRKVPAPKRGEFVRLIGEELRAAKDDLGRLVTLEAGKVTSEGLGEVQEMIDICDFAVGLSRQLYGLTIATERADHRMMETWHPLGVCGVISAFNFPVAVWSWNAALAFVCGDSVVWKPSEKTLLTALGVQAIVERAAKRFGGVPEGLSEVLIGGREVGEVLVEDERVPILSATGSTAMGRQVGPKLASRFARAILELGGNNAAIVAPSADLDLALRGIAFSAMGTAGQRCTTLRRLFVHDSVYDKLVPRLIKVYGSVKIGDPRAEGTLVGPLIDKSAFEGMERALDEARAAGGKVHGGGRYTEGACTDGYYARPALVEMPKQAGPGPARDLRADPLRDALFGFRRRDRRPITRSAPACHRRSSPPTCARPKPSSPAPVPIAASPTSISVPRGPRSAARSAARRKPAAVAKPARTPGRPICAAPPTPSITARPCRSRRASLSTSTPEASAIVSGKAHVPPSAYSAPFATHHSPLPKPRASP